MKTHRPKRIGIHPNLKGISAPIVCIFSERRAMDSFLTAYLTAALWTESDDNDQPLDKRYSIESFSPEALAKATAECDAFRQEVGTLFQSKEQLEQAGHDFWLTRNGHGCGFWDGDWPEPDATTLTDASHRAGGSYIIVGDDGQLHFG
jgi:hypothetical protein